MNVKLAQVEDVDLVVDLVLGFMDFLNWTPPAKDALKTGTLRLFACDESDFFLLYNDTGIAIGYVLQHYRYSQWSDAVDARLQALFVRPEMRQKGAGKMLVTFALEHAKSRGCKAMSLDSNENNIASAKIYASLGFVTTSKKWNGGTQILYKKPLT